tara:strand:- start:1957 stop:4233 length:2277 start_codon:yes stop_codon:yes gene_type:complete
VARRINELFNYILVLFLIYPSPVFADHVPTQPPYDQSIALDTSTGDLTIGIYSSDGFEDSPPEKYTIWFDISDSALDTSTAFCISTSFGHGTNLTWQYHVFDLEDLQYYFENPYGTFRTKIRADNDTDNSFSTLTAEQSISIPNQLPFVNLGNWTAPTDTCNDTSTTTTTTSSSTTSSTVPITAPNAPTNVSVNYGGEDVYFSWEYEAGEIDVVEFHINYSYDNQTWTRVVIDDTTVRTYTLDKSFIQTGTFYWEMASCGDLENNQSCANGDSNNFETTEYVPPTTTTLPPPPPPPTTTTTLYIVVNDDGSESEYTESQVEQGDVERDNQRKNNEEAYGCYMTDIQIERGDCFIEEIEEEDIIIVYEEESDTDEEFYEDDDLVFELELENEDIELEDTLINLSEEEILELEEQMEIDAKKLELEEDFEIFEFESEEEAEEFIKTIIELEEINFEEEFGIEEEVFELDIDFEDVIIIIEDEIVEEEIIEEIIEDEILEEDVELDRARDVVLPEKEVIEEPIEEEVELTQEEIEEEVAELEEVIEEIIVLDIPEVTEEELEELSEEELVEYEEAKEEAIEEYVEELETEEVVEILEEVNDVGVENLESASQEVIEVVAKVVEEVIQIASEEELTDEQAEVVGEVLGFDEETAKEDVEIIAEQAKEDVVIAEAVEVFVERAVENADSTALPYTLADVVVEIQFEEFVADPIGAIIDIDLQDIKISEIGADLTTDQKEKAQEVIVPTLLLRVASLALLKREV